MKWQQGERLARAPPGGTHPLPPREIQYGNRRHPITAWLLVHESAFSFALVSPDVPDSPGSWACKPMCGVDNLYDDDSADTCSLALQLRGILPGVTSMRQIAIHAEALAIRLVVTAAEAPAPAPAEVIR